MRFMAVLAPHAGHGADTCLTLVGLSSDRRATAHESTLSCCYDDWVAD